MGEKIAPGHPGLAAGGWARLTLCEQLAHVGGEVHRALNWRNRGNAELSERAFFRALELLDLCLAAGKTGPRLREIARLREALVDYFAGDNAYGSTDALWRGYFDHFNYAARRNR